LTLSQDKRASITAQLARDQITWKPGADIEQFWKRYSESKEELTWKASSTYPEYDKLKQGDTFLVQLNQGACLMDFFHRRWRRANDARRWSDSMNAYGGCPYVFD
jgi:hypothetical protein